LLCDVPFPAAAAAAAALAGLEGLLPLWARSAA
jgi:hypothetical protein